MNLAAAILFLTPTAAATARLGAELCASCAGGCLLQAGCRRPPSPLDGDGERDAFDVDCAAAGGVPCGLAAADGDADEPDEPEEEPKEKPEEEPKEEPKEEPGYSLL